MTAATTPTQQPTSASPGAPPAPKGQAKDAPKPAAKPAPPAKTITLRNLAGRRQIFHMHHTAACQGGGACRCKRVVVGTVAHDAVTGKKTVKAHVRRLPDTITLQPRGMKGVDAVSGLPEGVLTIPAVRKAVKARRVSWEYEKAAEGANAPVAHHPDAAGKLAAQERAKLNAKAAEPKPPPKADAPKKNAKAEG